MEKLYTYPNGLRLVYIQNQCVRSIALGIFVGAGSILENNKNNGVSHFIEHMTFKGTNTRSAFDIVNEIDSIGARINAFTTKHHTCYYTISLDKNIGKCAEVLSDLYFNSTFSEDELERERKVILEELSESEDTPDDVCLEKLSSVFFKDHPLSRTILGTKKSISQMTRTELLSYKEKCYTADNTVAVIVGDISFDEAKELIDANFNKHFVNNKFAFKEISAANFNSDIIVKSKKIEQAHLAFAFPSLSFSDKRVPALELMSMIFGLEMSSRLFQRVRERLGLCYTIYSYPSFYLKEGSFIIYTSTNPSSVESAVRAIKSEIDLLLKDGITLEELNKGKEQMKTGLVIGQESTTAIMRAHGRNVLFQGELFDIDKKIECIDALTIEDIANVAKEIFQFEKAAASFVGTKCNVDILKVLTESGS